MYTSGQLGKSAQPPIPKLTIPTREVTLVFVFSNTNGPPIAFKINKKVNSKF